MRNWDCFRKTLGSLLLHDSFLVTLSELPFLSEIGLSGKVPSESTLAVISDNNQTYFTVFILYKTIISNKNSPPRSKS